MHAVPGVEAAGFAVTLPLNDGRWEDAIRREGDPTRVQTFQNVVSPRYFEAMNIPLVAGRRFSDRDDDKAPRVALLNQALARILWPGESPIGKRSQRRRAESIGDHRRRARHQGPQPVRAGRPRCSICRCFSRTRRTSSCTCARPCPPRLSSRRCDARCTRSTRTCRSTPSRRSTSTCRATLTPQRLLAYLIGGFGVLALLLAAIGLYGCCRYSVTERTPEIGIRMALGARKADVMRLFVAGGMKLALAGVVLGSHRGVRRHAADEESAVRGQPARSADADRGSRRCCSSWHWSRARCPHTARHARIRRSLSATSEAARCRGGVERPPHEVRPAHVVQLRLPTWSIGNAAS